jgi:hypothetical protein
MGGSVSNGWTPTAPSNPCERIAFRASLNSPQPAVIATLNVGDVLDVALQTVPTTAVITLFNGVIAGALTGTQVNALVNCIQNGFQYNATVVSISGGNCVVDVRHI